MFFDIHVAKCKNAKRTIRSNFKNCDSSKNVSVVNTSKGIDDIEVTALMSESNKDQELPD